MRLLVPLISPGCDALCSTTSVGVELPCNVLAEGTPAGHGVPGRQDQRIERPNRPVY